MKTDKFPFCSRLPGPPGPAKSRSEPGANIESATRNRADSWQDPEQDPSRGSRIVPDFFRSWIIVCWLQFGLVAAFEWPEAALNVIARHSENWNFADWRRNLPLCEKIHLGALLSFFSHFMVIFRFIVFSFHSFFFPSSFFRMFFS